MADAPGFWPSGTNAIASSYHADEAVPPYDTFDPFNAIDNNETTKWNDNTNGVFPDALLIIPSTTLNLSGIVLVSAQGGWITDFGVRVSDDPSMRDDMINVPIIANMTGISKTMTTFTFPKPMRCALVQVDVFASENSDYSRIHEVYPIFAQAESSSPTSSTISSTSISSSTAIASPTGASPVPASPTPSSGSASDSASNSASSNGSGTNAGAIAGGVVGGVAAILLIVFALYMVRRRKKKQPAAPVELSGEAYRPELEHKPRYELS